MNRTHSLKRKPFKKKPVKSRRLLKKNLTKRGAKSNAFEAVRAEYGLPEAIKRRNQLRYTSPLERGVLWYYFSLFIRARDKDLPCISCGFVKEKYQAGHFIPAGEASWDGFVFDETNVHAECPFCNLRDKRKLKYGINLEKRLPGAKADLEARHEAYKASQGTYRNWNREQLGEKIRHYKALLSEMGEKL